MHRLWEKDRRGPVAPGLDTLSRLRITRHKTASRPRPARAPLPMRIRISIGRLRCGLALTRCEHDRRIIVNPSRTCPRDQTKRTPAYGARAQRTCSTPPRRPTQHDSSSKALLSRSTETRLAPSNSSRHSTRRFPGDALILRFGRIWGPETLHQTPPQPPTVHRESRSGSLETHHPRTARNIRRYLGSRGPRSRSSRAQLDRPAARSAPQTRARTRLLTDATGRPTRDP